jgi:hypothetical protein
MLGHEPKRHKSTNHFKILGPWVAEREGFEPPIRLPVFRISSAARSTTLPPLRGRKGQQARSVGRYVSNAAGRNKGGAPTEIDELIGGMAAPGRLICWDRWRGRFTARRSSYAQRCAKSSWGVAGAWPVATIRIYLLTTLRSYGMDSHPRS